MGKPILSQSRVIEAFDYNPKTGELIWRIQRTGTSRIGAEAGSIHKKGYRIICIDGVRYKAHHICFFHYHGFMPKMLDHKNRNRLDNRIDNLRESTNQQNCCNRNPTGVSKYLGVSPFGKRWRSQINKGGEVRYLGLFDSEEAAAMAYDKEAVIIHGEYANPNFLLRAGKGK